MGKVTCVLFDLDGTLLNTNKLIIKSFRHTFYEHLQLEVSEAQLYKYFGEPLRTTLARYAPDRVEELLATYRQFNMENHDKLTTVFPEAIEVMSNLHKHGIKMGIVTSKLRMGALMGIELAGFDQFVSSIVTNEDTVNHKPHPEPILKALEQLGESPETSVMVGDSPFDWGSARNAKVTSVAVSWSVHPAQIIEAERPDYTIDNFAQLLPICGLKP